jgi:ELWxxDGT repeat protein
VTHRQRLYFPACDRRHGCELWSSKGTSATTRLVRDLRPGPRDSRPAGLISLGRRLFFVARTKAGRELWQTDGDRRGTALVQDIEPGPGSSHPQEQTAWDMRLFFQATDGSAGAELWVHDPSA